MMIARPAPQEGLGADYTRVLSRRSAAAGVLAALTLVCVVSGWWVGPLVLPTSLGAAAVIRIAHRSFDGISGDLLGAVEQVGECVVLIVVSGLAIHHRPWWS